MTATALALTSNHPDRPGAQPPSAPALAAGCSRSGPQRCYQAFPTAGMVAVTGRGAAGNGLPVSRPGVIGGAVIRAARRSAGLPLRGLARRMSVSPAEARSWESGATPLFCMPYPEIRDLADTLTRAGATGGCEPADLLLASQCDLLVTGMLHGFEDYAEVPPIDAGPEGEPARGLLRWALTGRAPHHYAARAMPGPLLARADVIRFETIACELRAGCNDSELISFGQAFTDLVKP